MMHGYAITQARPLPFTHGLLGNEWTVLPIMGFGLLLVIGLVVWFLLTQRHEPAHVTTASQAPAQQVPGPQAYAPAPVTDPAEEIVRDRFARGEIDSDEYTRLIATLRTR